MSLDALQAYEDSASESGEEAAAQWNGEVWEDANEWCKALLGLCTRVFGDDCKSGGEPYWGAPNDSAFLAMEEYRRGLPDDCLYEFARLPYYSELQIAEYTPGRSATVSALLCGTGEKFGEWDAYTLFWPKPSHDHPSSLRELVVGEEVTVGKFPFEEQAVVARILRGTKPAGRAAEAKTQHCYYVLLKVGANFKYVAMQHITPEWRGRAAGWDDVAFEGVQFASEQMVHFKPKSVSAMAKAAALYVKKLAGTDAEPQPKRPCPPKVPTRSERGQGKAVAWAVKSDSESDLSDAEEASDSES